MKNILYILTIITIVNVQLGAQTEGDSLIQPRALISLDRQEVDLPDLVLISKSTDEGTIIRWAPTNPQTWQMGVDNGYVLERRVGKSREFERVTPDNIMPWTEAKWKNRVGDDEKYLTIAAMSIYGESNTGGFVHAARDVQNRHAYTLLAADLDGEAAEAAGLRYLETDMTDNIYGQYRIYTIDAFTGIKSDTAMAIIGYMGVEELLAPELTIIENEGAVQLTWSGGGRFRANERMTGFYIERSVDGQRFTRLLEDPFMNVKTALDPERQYTTYIDSVDNGMKHYYRVIGIDAFADQTPPSNMVSGMGKDLTPPSNASQLTIVENENKQLQLSWDWTRENAQRDLRGFNIYRSATKENGYEKINDQLLSTNVRTYLDENPNQRKLNYYYIEAIDANENASRSITNVGHIVDRIPPAPPTEITGEIDTTGLILIEWTPPSDEDIRGYELFFSNNVETGFIKMSSDITPNEFYIDSTTFHTLTEEIYYQVITVDYNYNRSEASDYLTLKRPDIIPPAASIFTDYEVTEEGIQFSWRASQSSDVVAILLMRREKGQEWIELTDFDRNEPSYTDNNITEGVRYEYTLVTVDDDANESRPAKSLTLEALKSQFLDQVTGIALNEMNGKYTLKWKYENSESTQFHVYKVTDYGPSLFKKVNGKTEVSVPMDELQSFKYSIKAKAKDGRESRMSEYATYK